MSRYEKGSYNADCDQCGNTRKASQMRLQNWNKLFVCKTCWERRQPQDFVTGSRDVQRVPIARARGPIIESDNSITGDDL